MKLTTEDYLDMIPNDRASCANCTHRGGYCARSSKRKDIHNGCIYRNGEIVGVISRCGGYTGKFKNE